MSTEQFRNKNRPHQSETHELAETLDKDTIENIVEVAKDKAESFSNKRIKAHQIRNFYGAINQLKLDYEQSRNMDEDKFSEGAWKKLNRELVLLKPKLAYAKGRNKDVESFTRFMTEAINKTITSTNKKQALENFFELVQAVVAYHKFFGDGEK